MEDTTTIDKQLGLFESLSRRLSLKVPRSILSRQPVLNYGLCLLTALLGYFVVVGMPLLVIILPFTFLNVFSTTDDVVAISQFAVLLTVWIFSVSVSFTLFRLKFMAPQGPELHRERYRQLFQVIDEIREHYKTPLLHIERVVLCDSFEIRLVRTPHMGVPVVFKHTLLIGLPALQAMDATAFKALLARELSRAGMRHNYVAGWLVSLLPIWKQFVRAAAKTGWYGKPVYWFFRVYVQFYQSLLSGLQKSVFLRAEHEVLDLINDRDFLEVLTAEVVIKDFINNKYWPKIRKTAMQPTGTVFKPHARMMSIVRKFSHSRKYSRMIEKALQQKNNPGSFFASLSERVHNIGHHSPAVPAPLEATAADVYLGTTLKSVVSVMDKKWQLGFSQIVRRHTSF